MNGLEINEMFPFHKDNVQRYTGLRYQKTNFQVFHRHDSHISIPKLQYNWLQTFVIFIEQCQMKNVAISIIVPWALILIFHIKIKVK